LVGFVLGGGGVEAKEGFGGDREGKGRERNCVVYVSVVQSIGKVAS